MIAVERPNIHDLTHNDLTHLIAGWGFPRYRADQVWEWIYKHKVNDFDAMTNMPSVLRERLAAETRLTSLEIARELLSSDGETCKYLFRLSDGQLIETVLMEYSGVRRTVCISTQAGCAMECVFCATGQMGFVRHLTAGEIIEQALFVARALGETGEHLSNVVLMGMGEPFHNYDATIEAVRRLTDPKALGIGQRRVTVSTVGLVPAIRRFARENLQVGLAISLHAATDEERSALLPMNNRYPLRELMAAVRDYIEQTNRRVTFEWALIACKNDSAEQARALGGLLGEVLCHVNVIPLNPTNGYAGDRPDKERVDRFVGIVESYKIPVTVRVRRGIDINAGCGQLKAEVVGRG